MYLIPRNMDLFRPRESLFRPWREDFFNDYFDPFVVEDEKNGSEWSPPMDFVDDNDRYVLFVDAPGMEKSDINIKLREGILFVEGTRKHEKEVDNKNNTKYLLERRCGGFRRHFHLHVDVMKDDIKADYSNGVLKVTIPKDMTSTVKNIPIEIT